VVQPDGTLFDPNGDKHHFTVKGETVDVPTVGNEQFDRLFIAVSAPRLFHSDVFNIVPKVYYYQTVYNDGEDHFGQLRIAVSLLFLTRCLRAQEHKSKRTPDLTQR
jgi:hypothetical protein